MVNLVLVSHSKSLAMAVRNLAAQVSGGEVEIAIAAGTGEDHNELGTDAVHVSEVLTSACGEEGAIVLMDLGSAILSTETALELIDQHLVSRIRLCPGPLVEGAIAAAVSARHGGSLDDVFREARAALAPKEDQLAPGAMFSANSSSAVTAPSTAEIILEIQNEHGLHIRPAARLVAVASRFSADIQVWNESANRGPAPAKSMSGLALLQVRKRDRIRVRAAGSDAISALHAIGELARTRFDETDLPERIGSDGKAASPGIAIGTLLPIERARHTVRPDTKEPPKESSSSEWTRLESVLGRIRSDLAPLADTTGILTAQFSLTDDPILLEKIRSLIYRDGNTALEAWTGALNDLTRAYGALDDEYLRSRAADLRELSQRVEDELQGRPAIRSISPPEPSILFAKELLAREAAVCDPTTVLGVVAASGSPTAHSSIMLRTLGIPMVVGIDLTSALGCMVAIDGSTGEVTVSPDPATLAELKARRRAQGKLGPVSIPQHCVTRDGQEIELLANVASRAEASVAASNGAQGIGVLRSEFLFVDRLEAPSRYEQVQILRDVLKASPPGPVVVRTLDAGADKPLRVLPMQPERNPFLGLRGIRLLLKHSEFFVTHLEAILMAGAGRDLWLMLPMISEKNEIEKARALLETAHRNLEADQTPHVWPAKLGTMIEVPSAALLAEHLADSVDFFSIGTNDLTQYVLAAERENASLASFQDALHPAVLRLIASVTDVADRHQKHISVCGDAASDPIAAAVFFGLGIRSLSVRPPEIPGMKSFFSHQNSEDLKHISNRALTVASAAQVRVLCSHLMQENG